MIITNFLYEVTMTADTNTGHKGNTPPLTGNGTH